MRKKLPPIKLVIIVTIPVLSITPNIIQEKVVIDNAQYLYSAVFSYCLCKPNISYSCSFTLIAFN